MSESQDHSENDSVTRGAESDRNGNDEGDDDQEDAIAELYGDEAENFEDDDEDGENLFGDNMERYSIFLLPLMQFTRPMKKKFFL
jgi:hypothetical protein